MSVSARDMIRKMKDNVTSMEEEMTNLLANMDKISGSCEHLEVLPMQRPAGIQEREREREREREKGYKRGVFSRCHYHQC